MRGFTRNNKFVPMTDYKKVTRKSRDTKAKTQGIKFDGLGRKLPVKLGKIGDIVKVSQGSGIDSGKVGKVIGRKPAEDFPQSAKDWYQVRIIKPEHMKGVIIQQPRDRLEKISLERKARDPAIFDKAHELRNSEFKYEPSTQKNLTTQGSIRFLIDDIQSEIPKKTEIGLAIDLERSNVSEKVLEEQIKFLEKSAIDMYKFKQIGKIKPVRIKQADRDELHRRIGDRLLMQVANLDSAPSPDFQKRGLTLRKLHQQDASEDEFFGHDKF